MVQKEEEVEEMEILTKKDEEGTEDNQKMSKDDSEGGVTEGEGTPP